MVTYCSHDCPGVMAKTVSEHSLMLCLLLHQVTFGCDGNMYNYSFITGSNNNGVPCLNLNLP